VATYGQHLEPINAHRPGSRPQFRQPLDTNSTARTLAAATAFASGRHEPGIVTGSG
jgi:hypothetical protein